jgi:phospholipid N-methyltransferase
MPATWEAGLPPTDCVVSGIPFSFFDPPQRLELAQTIHDVLSPKGRFVAFQFTTHLIPVLNKTFRDVDVSLEVRNLPPALVMTAKK